jgi:hypothetical protein
VDQDFGQDGFERPALGLGSQGVDDGALRLHPQGGAHLAELQVQVDQHHRAGGALGQEQGGVGGQKGLARSLGGRGHGDDPAQGRAGEEGGAVAPPAPGDGERPPEGQGEVVGVVLEGQDVVRSDLHDVPEAALRARPHDQHQGGGRGRVVQCRQVLEPAQGQDRRTGHHQVDAGQVDGFDAGQPVEGEDVGDGLEVGDRLPDLVRQPGRALQDQDPGHGVSHPGSERRSRWRTR